jgi:hypothetical protein
MVSEIRRMTIDHFGTRNQFSGGQLGAEFLIVGKRSSISYYFDFPAAR